MKQKFKQSQLAKDILTKRIKDNLSFSQVAELLNDKISKSSLHRLEDKGQSPSAEVLADICNWLGKPVSYYF